MGEDAPPRGAGAVVLLASPQVGEQLRQVMDSGWAGPVVLVSSVAEARDLVGAAPATPATPTTPTNPGSPGRPRLVMDPGRQAVCAEGVEERLTPLEYSFLEVLLDQVGQVCPFADLTQQVWGTRHLGDVSQVHSLVKRLRRKLDGIESPIQVQALRGVGFRAVLRRPPPASADRES